MPCQVVGGVIICSRSRQLPTDKAGPGYVTGICRMATDKGLDDNELMNLVRSATGHPWDPDRMTCGRAWRILEALKRLPDRGQPTLFDE